MCSNQLLNQFSLVQVLLSFYLSMLKSFLISKRNGAHCYKKRMFEKNKDKSLSKFECFNEHAKKNLICVKQWACKLCN
jgi:hypothetical protein